MIVISTIFITTANATEIKMVVSTPVGNGVDIIGRMLATEMSKRLDLTVIVENKPGGGGTIAAQDVVNNEEKILFTNAAIISAPNVIKSVGYNVKKDIIPIAIINENPEVLLTKAGRFKDLPDFLKQSNNSTLPFKAGIIGFGSGSYFITKDFIIRSKIKVDDIPYNSLNSAILDLIAGRIDFIMATIPTTYALIVDGKLDALAQMAPSRIIKELSIPSIKEYGFDSYINWWNGLFVSSKMTAQNIKIFKEVFQKIKQDPQFIIAMHKILSDVSPDLSDAELKQFIHDEIELYSKLSKYINDRR